jgi:hypothetical protein
MERERKVVALPVIAIAVSPREALHRGDPEAQDNPLRMHEGA